MRLPGLRSFREADIFGLEEPHVAFYVGAALAAKEGADLGMLCAPATHALRCACLPMSERSAQLALARRHARIMPHPSRLKHALLPCIRTDPCACRAGAWQTRGRCTAMPTRAGSRAAWRS